MTIGRRRIDQPDDPRPSNTDEEEAERETINHSKETNAQELDYLTHEDLESSSGHESDDFDDHRSVRSNPR
jgi:hypothetical protein